MGPVLRRGCATIGSSGPARGWRDGAVLAWIRFEKAEKTYAEIPYLWLDDVNINLDKDVLTISSEVENSKEKTEDNFYRKEFTKSSFSRSFYIPEDIDASKINAKMEDGILKITIPKKEPKDKAKVSIKIK